MKKIGRITSRAVCTGLWPIHAAFVLWIILSSAYTDAAYAQIPPARVEVTLLAGTEERLWLADTHAKSWRLTQRNIQTRFARPASWNGRVLMIAPYGDRLLAFFDDGSVYRAAEQGGLEPEPTMPGSRPPVAVAAVQDRAYLMLRTTDSGALVRDAELAETDSSHRELCLATYDGGAWKLVAYCPAALRADVSPPPRIVHHNGVLLLAGFDARVSAVRTWMLDLPTLTWSELDRIEAETEPDSLWLCVTNRVPTLLRVMRGAEGGASHIEVFRRMPVASETNGRIFWRKAAPYWSELPDGFQPIQLRGVAGFNQHLVVLAVDGPGRAIVRYARFEGPPLDTSQDVADIFDRPDPVARVAAPLQMLTVLILVIVFSLLFTLRRGAMLEAAILPPGWELALITQRILAGLIDFIPFSVAAALLLKLPWWESLQQIITWAASVNYSGEEIEPVRLLTWWTLSTGGYTLYSLVMELIAQRTIGKVLVGLRLLTDVGARPAMWQIVLRNLMRPVELLPSIWVLGFLMVLSRNRQRLGDIFARVVVVRRSPTVTPDQSAAPGKDPE